jgi:hypothetical protein
MTRGRGNPLFEPLRGPVGEFIGKLKALSGLNAHR